MSKPITAKALTSCQAAVIWQPYTEDRGPGEPAILCHADATGLLVIEQEDRAVLIQPEALPALIKQLQRLAKETPKQ